jgi:hypothetical protein
MKRLRRTVNGKHFIGCATHYFAVTTYTVSARNISNLNRRLQGRINESRKV